MRDDSHSLVTMQNGRCGTELNNVKMESTGSEISPQKMPGWVMQFLEL